MSLTLRDRFRGSLLGLAAGDAVGTTVEFLEPGTFEPVVDMTGGGAFDLEPGEFTDDTSMALCLAESLVRVGFNPWDQMRRYVRWYREGYWSPTGDCVDIGETTRGALESYIETGDLWKAAPIPGRDAGNGSIMRLAPAVLWAYPDHEKAVDCAVWQGIVTHPSRLCQQATALLARMLLEALEGAPKEAILRCARGESHLFQKPLRRVALESYQRKGARIRGTGYVADSLQAAVWAFWSTDSFEAAILAAANLGRDADTTAAVTGQIAGAFYGAEAIPAAWRERLAMSWEITVLADQLHDFELDEDERRTVPGGFARELRA